MEWAAMNNEQFKGFEPPKTNYSKLPHALIEALSRFSSLAELKVVLYILRHTWGFQEFEVLKRITLDEFQHGRKRKDRSRLDGGTGMSKNAIREGIKRAIDNGFIVKGLGRRNRPGRPASSYQLKEYSAEVDPLSKNKVQKLTLEGAEVDPSSEKDTLERYPYEKDTMSPSGDEISGFDEGGAPIDTPKPKKRYISKCEYEDEEGNIEVIEDDNWKQPQKQIDYQALGACGREGFRTEKEYNKLRKIEAMLESGKLSEEFWRNRMVSAEKHHWSFPDLLRYTLSVDLQRKWKRQQQK